MINNKVSEEVFSINCEKWSLTDPQKALLLSYVDCEPLQFCQTSQGELNLKYQEEKNELFFHSQEGALKEAEAWFRALDLTDIPLIYVYGVGLGYYYLAAQQWLHQDPSRRIVFIEDNLAVIHRLFETDLGSQLIHDPQVQLHFFEGMEKSKELFNILYWNFFMTTLQVSALDLYKKVKAAVYVELEHKIHYDASVKNSLLVEYLEYGVGFFKNYYPNILCLEGDFLADDLYGKFQNVPAIICGAGPSLEKNLSLLGDLSHHALLFAGGSALNALNKKDIQPHFGAGIDPNAPQYDRLSTNTTFEVPFFYRNRLFHKAFQTIHGPRLYVTGSGGYDVSHLIEERLNIQGKPLEEGHNVVNFCLEIAHALGCNPIIFVGMDLAYTGMKAYASGVVENNDVDAKEITRMDYVDQAALLKTDIHGNPIYTLWKWMAEADWIGSFAKENPDVTVINATEGGLGFPGVRNMTLQEVADQYLKEQYDLRGWIHSEIFNGVMPDVTTEKIEGIIQELEESLQRCVEDFNILIEETEVVKTRIEKEKAIPFPLQTGRASLYESDLAEEIGYIYVLQIFNEAYSRVLNRELQALHIAEVSEIDLTLGKLAILIKRFIFLRDTASINIALIQMAKREYEPRKTYPMQKPGKVYLEQLKEQGKIQGDSLYYTRKQQLAKAHFDKGVQEGKAAFLYPNGQLYSHQNFHSGKWDGKQEFYYPDGTLKTVLEYEKGHLIKVELFNTDGSQKLLKEY